uniref:Uncharacterized protein n=1 Tax=Amphimedon queenslandica TaxID=400682 RepID=A0A1X7SH38_AMPQE
MILAANEDCLSCSLSSSQPSKIISNPSPFLFSNHSATMGTS